MSNHTISTYNKFYKEYDEDTMVFWERFPKTIIDAFVNGLYGKKILDLGSGPGRDAELLRQRDLNITCYDGSESMVQVTAKKGFESILGDLRRLPFDKETFDGVWAYTSLLHLAKIEADEVVGTIRSILKPSGLFAIGMIEGVFEGDKDRGSMPGGKRFFRFYTSDELKEMIIKHSFTLLYEEKYQPHTTIYLNQIYKKI